MRDRWLQRLGPAPRSIDWGDDPFPKEMRLRHERDRWRARRDVVSIGMPAWLSVVRFQARTPASGEYALAVVLYSLDPVFDRVPELFAMCVQRFSSGQVLDADQCAIPWARRQLVSREQVGWIPPEPLAPEFTQGRDVMLASLFLLRSELPGWKHEQRSLLPGLVDPDHKLAPVAIPEALWP